jgi:ethanolamine utilization protein EutA
VTAPLRFSGNHRHAGEEDELRLTSVGIDIGSSTSHLIFSLLRLERRGSKYVTVERRVLRQSDIMLTPFTAGDDSVIDGPALREFIDREYATAGLTRADVDTGALILTGLAVRRDNAREIGDLFADEAGRFVMVTAGDGLEATMAGYGSGAVAGSAEPAAGPTLCIDLGGGTTKLAVCEQGKVTEVTALDIGARLLLLDDERVVTRIEPAGRYLLDALGIRAAVGDQIPEEALERLASRMADAIFEVATTGVELPEVWRPLMRLPALSARPLPSRIFFSGGVSEFLTGQEGGNFGDLGGRLARAVAARFGDASVRSTRSAGIRATAMGASQHTMQVSGSTIFVDPLEVLPIRNLPVIAPLLDLEDEELDAAQIGNAIAADLERIRIKDSGGAAALALHWVGSATYRRLSALCDGLLRGMSTVLAAGHPLVVVSEGDIGGLIGMHLRSVEGMGSPVVSVDGIELKEFDYVDVGEIVPSTGAVPVVIKSLVFPAG